MRRLFFLAACATFVATGQAVGQSFTSDTSFVTAARSNAIKRYNAEVGLNSNIYNGSEYYEYAPQADEHPYFRPDWIFGSVIYGRERYDNVPLLFDVAEDQLITSYIYGNAIRLVREKVQSFTIGDDRFVKVNNEQVAPAFYQLVYSNKTSFLVRRQKTFYIKLDGTVPINKFDVRVLYYLVKDGKYHAVRGTRSLLAGMGDHKQEVKKFIRERKIRYKKNKELSAYRILEFYDQLTP